MIKRLYLNRFELFLFSQMFILFGSLIVPSVWFHLWVSPLLLLFNLMIGVVFVSLKKWIYFFTLALLVLTGLIFLYGLFEPELSRSVKLIRLVCFFLFYGIVSFEIIQQVAKATVVEKNVILGLISGYISLGLLAFFMFMIIEILNPNSFSGIDSSVLNNESLSDELMYFSFVTLLTIGYGEILPISSLAQKGAILVALIGQFYIVVLTAIVVGKYINDARRS